MEHAYSPPQQLLPLRTTMTAFRQTFPAPIRPVYVSEHRTRIEERPFLPANCFNTSYFGRFSKAAFQRRSTRTKRRTRRPYRKGSPTTTAPSTFKSFRPDTNHKIDLMEFLYHGVREFIASLGLNRGPVRVALSATTKSQTQIDVHLLVPRTDD
jgi:hypothetical protein